MRWGSKVSGMVVALGLALTACGGGSDASPPPSDEERRDRDSAAPADTAPAGPSDAVADEPSAQAEDPVDSIVTVETPLTSGTGLVFDQNLVVVPSDVIDPFFAVQVYVDGDPRTAQVRGVDLETGLAVVGPVDLSGAPFTPLDQAAVEVGEAVRLLVAPEPGADDEVDEIGGRVAAFDRLDEWPVGLVDVDVDRKVGRIGAPVVTGDGRVVGLGGFAWDEGVEVALDAATAQRSIDAIVGGDGDWPHMPDTASARENSAYVDLSFDGSAALYFPNAWHPGEQELAVPPGIDVQLEVVSHANEVLLVNPRAQAAGLGEEDGAAVVEPAADGTYELRYPDTDHTTIGVFVYLTLPEGATAPEPFEVTSPYEFAAIDPVPEIQEIGVGDTVSGVVGSFEDTDRFEVRLSAGETVTIFTRSPTGDIGFDVRGPDGWVLAEGEDGLGYLGLDEGLHLRASTDGVYEIRVSQTDGLATAYQLEIVGAAR